MNTAILAFSLAIWLGSPATGAENKHYDLGGPCKDIADPGMFGQIRQAKKNGSWDRVVELEKLDVRDSCGNQYRWFELVSALLHAHRPSDALQVLEEMDSRGFDLSPEPIRRQFSEIQNFMEAPVFGASPLGQKLRHLRSISDNRRAKYRERLSSLSPKQKPPKNYVAKGVCPFECCQYCLWNVLEDVDLVAAPGSKRIVGKALKGSHALGLTGEVHLRPEPVVVLKEVDGELPKDSIAFVLDYGGEGYGHVYTQGKVVSVFLGFADYCFQVSESCWGETLFSSKQRSPQVWWVKVRLSNGVTGWTDKSDHFGNQDACG